MERPCVLEEVKSGSNILSCIFKDHRHNCE